nr:uncharacterized protein LOC105330815 [Crassostrea gigas]
MHLFQKSSCFHMMISAGILVLFIVIPSETCIWIPTVEQQDFCSAQYVFGADILNRSSENEMFGFVYNIRVADVYRYNGIKDIVKGFKTIYGEGRANSCGPQLLDVNSSYILYATEREGELQIDDYRQMQYVEKDDIDRMSQMYDCSCEVRFNYIAVQTNNADFQLNPPTTDQCNVPSDYCRRSFYCKRNPTGSCVVGNHGNCY